MTADRPLACTWLAEVHTFDDTSSREFPYCRVTLTRNRIAMLLEALEDLARRQDRSGALAEALTHQGGALLSDDLGRVSLAGVPDSVREDHPLYGPYRDALKGDQCGPAGLVLPPGLPIEEGHDHPVFAASWDVVCASEHDRGVAWGVEPEGLAVKLDVTGPTGQELIHLDRRLACYEAEAEEAAERFREIEDTDERLAREMCEEMQMLRRAFVDPTDYLPETVSGVGPPGAEALVRWLDHDDPQVRQTALTLAAHFEGGPRVEGAVEASTPTR